MKFFWVKNEWEPAFLDNKYIFGNEPRVGALGWSDKLWHFFCEWILTILLWPTLLLFLHHNTWSMVLSGIISFTLGFLWEWIVDCIILKTGASKMDLVADFVGCLLGIFSILYIFIVLYMGNQTWW